LVTLIESYGGITAAPEFAEAKNIMEAMVSLIAPGISGGDIHIIDHFHFDDHSSQGRCKI
jgi:maltoporin